VLGRFTVVTSSWMPGRYVGSLLEADNKRGLRALPEEGQTLSTASVLAREK
jgi:hypothetical protein